MEYYIGKKIDIGFAEAVAKVTAGLKTEGFGVISEIDLHDKLKEKLNVDFRKYKILGACNPIYAYKALHAEDKIGTMLPCNVIIQELAEGKIEVAAVNPMASMKAVKNEALVWIAYEIKEKLTKVVNRL
ncbi:MAG: DUF302 domain-containing protein [Bacteroidales bacterium]|nr:DUF302 domain-containing protein [Bacteroidales bacterium]